MNGYKAKQINDGPITPLALLKEMGMSEVERIIAFRPHQNEERSQRGSQGNPTYNRMDCLIAWNFARG